MSKENKPNVPDELKEHLASLKAEGMTPDGARFIAYISPSDDTASHLTKWEVRLEHDTSDWFGTITSAHPKQMLCTPKLYGRFHVHVTASGPDIGEDVTAKLLPPDHGIPYNPDVMVSIDNAGMIGIVTRENGKELYYWTVSDML